ncbi:restless-like transposase [Fusarium albosuccineum]|uniref:Restless-like transposase n=1 Tax=Fusarium albosuccineum TaxID=1237068 RepID=A0A8H4PFZ2_9HYPO|nr:restless-like transposase [Fusarium albosuccineum]
MAPITCKVADPFGAGIQGIYVILECKDQYGNISSKYESFSDDGGNVHYWFDFTPMGKSVELRPRVINVLNVPRVTLTFLPGLKGSCFPWASIQTDVYLSDEGSHEFLLALHPNCASYHLEHAMFTAFCQGNSEMECDTTPEYEMIDFNGSSRSPSPLQLPPPVIKPVRRADPPKRRVGKRKLTLDSDDDSRRLSKRNQG